MAKQGTRIWARGLSTERLTADIEHCRTLWSCIRDGRYDVHYALTIGVYRAELARRS